MKAGDKVMLTEDIYDDGCDNHHPPGFIAMKGEIVVVRKVVGRRLQVSHEHITNRSFMIDPRECKPAPEPVALVKTKCDHHRKRRRPEQLWWFEIFVALPDQDEVWECAVDEEDENNECDYVEHRTKH